MRRLAAKNITEIRVFSKEDIQSFVSATVTGRHGLRDRALLFLALGSGLRISEICNLQIINIISSRNETKIMAANFGKGTKGSRLVDISSETETALNEYLQARIKEEALPFSPLFPSPKEKDKFLRTNSAWKRLRQIFKKAEVECVSTRSLRRTCAHQLFKEEPDIKKIQVQMGLKSFLATSSLLVPRQSKKQPDTN